MGVEGRKGRALERWQIKSEGEETLKIRKQREKTQEEKRGA